MYVFFVYNIFSSLLVLLSLELTIGHLECLGYCLQLPIMILLICITDDL
jgi:hypothetical protein